MGEKEDSRWMRGKRTTEPPLSCLISFILSSSSVANRSWGISPVSPSSLVSKHAWEESTLGRARKTRRVSSEGLERKVSASLVAVEQKAAAVDGGSGLKEVGRETRDRKRSWREGGDVGDERGGE